MKDTTYRLLLAVCRAFYAVFLPLRATGIEHIPATGPVLLIANHESLGDPVAVECTAKRRFVFMAKRELFRIWPLNKLLISLGCFPVDRGNSDLSAVRAALKVLKDGDAFGIFPQGRRTFKGADHFHTGAALLALRSGAPVIPLYIDGRPRLFRPVRLYYGAPVDLSAFSGRIDSVTLERATECMREAVYALRPS